MFAISYIVLSCIGRDLTMGRCPVQETIPKCLNAFKVSEVNSNSEEVRGSYSCKVKRQQIVTFINFEVDMIFDYR